MKKLIYITAILVLISGCSKDWLETTPLGKDTEINYYANLEAANTTVTTAYGNFGRHLVFDVYLIVNIGGAPSDDIETGGENIFDAGNFAGDIFQFSPTDQYTEYFWNYCYKGIRYCCTAEEKLNIVNETASQAEKSIIKVRIAEMKFLRAYYHFLIAQVFGGGPYIKELVTPDLFTTTPRLPLADFYKAIETELIEAIPDLPNRTEQAAEDVGRASKGAAQALLGKLYLYESSYANNYPGDDRFTNMRPDLYDDALTQFESVMNAPGYALVGLDSTETFTSWWNSFDSEDRESWGNVGAYRWVFTADADNSPESVWEIQRIMDGLDYLRTRGTYLTIYTSPRLIRTSGGEALPELGWSFNSPTSYLEAAFGNSDERETGLSSTAAYSGSLDPRYPVTISKEGDSLLYETDGETWIRLDMSGGGKNNVPTHMLCRKYEASPAEFWNAFAHHQNSPVNTKLIRMGDVYLMAAEAALLSGNSGKALQYVNAVRKRARLSGVEGGYPAYTGYPRDLSAVNLNDIMHERRIELGGEGHRYFDLVRWNKTEFMNVEVAERSTTAQFTKRKNEFFPVPLSEIQASEGTIVQNLNY